MTSDNIRPLLATLENVAAIATANGSPNGTTKKIEKMIRKGLTDLLDEVYAAASNPNVPNGTTLAMLQVMENR